MISIYGAGYVGLVCAACFASLGNRVTCVDVDSALIDRLNRGEIPLYEEYLAELIQHQRTRGYLSFTNQLSSAIQASSIHIITVGTLNLPDGQPNVADVFSVALQIANETSVDCHIVIKSTVAIGTGDALEEKIKEEQKRLGRTQSIQIVSNPEFLREGSAVNDFLSPDRVIIGGDTTSSITIQNLYQPLAEKGVPILIMTRIDAELTKYTANAMLACKISFMNQISQIAEKVGADVDQVKHGISLDHRIGPHFIQAGIGYGGSCFPKDVDALIYSAKKLGLETPLLGAITEVNRQQKNWVIDVLKRHFHNNFQQLKIGIWGLAFKPGTDDIREGASIPIINQLLSLNVSLSLYDPVAMPNMKKYIGHQSLITWCDTAEEVLNTGIDALVIVTEWGVFKKFPLPVLYDLLGDIPIIDGRNCFELLQIQEAGFSTYYSVGRPVIASSHAGEAGVSQNHPHPQPFSRKREKGWG